MKLLYDTAVNEVIAEEVINEATNSKKYYIKGIFSSPGVKNKNGRIYPKEIWENEVNKYQNVLKSGSSNSLLELNHPPRQDVDMMEAVGKMTKLYWKDGFVMGEAVLLDNEKANQLKTLIDNGIKMSVSSRGVGSVKNGLVEKFNLITFDIIPNQQQSDINASMMGIVEGILEDKEFEINESGIITEVKMCSKNECNLFEAEDVKEATKQKFNDILEAIKSIKSNKSNELSKIDITKKKLKDLDYEKTAVVENVEIWAKKGSEPYTDIVSINGNEINISKEETKKALESNKI